jgi:hypothetical protein
MLIKRIIRLKLEKIRVQYLERTHKVNQILYKILLRDQREW